MGWFNLYGLLAVAILLIPNIVWACRHRGEAASGGGKALPVLEQIGRYGCMACMVFNIPYATLGFWFSHAFLAYLAGNGTLLALYLLGWLIKGKGTVKALWLSVLPTLLFVFSGILLLSLPLLFFAVLFGIGHITVSYKNAKEKGAEQ